MYQVEMYTFVGFSGGYFENCNDAIKYVKNSTHWYYAKITNEADSSVISEQERPYFVENCIKCIDNYTGETFYSHACFKSMKEAEQARRNSWDKIKELHGKYAYFNV